MGVGGKSVRGIEKCREGNSSKVKKVLGHQSSWPTVGGDISLVHFVNREIVCGESGSVRVTRKDSGTRWKRKPSED